MERKVSGPVLLSFTIDEHGAPRDIHATGDPLLTPEVKYGFRDVQFPRHCSGKQVSIVIRFRIDDSLPLRTPVAVRRISGSDYEVVSPGENIVVISDPPITWKRPTGVPVEVWRVGDDGLTVRLSDALENAFDVRLATTLGPFRQFNLAHPRD